MVSMAKIKAAVLRALQDRHDEPVAVQVIVDATGYPHEDVVAAVRLLGVEYLIEIGGTPGSETYKLRSWS